METIGASTKSSTSGRPQRCSQDDDMHSIWFIRIPKNAVWFAFQHFIDTQLRDFPFTSAHLDDILIASSSHEQHEKVGFTVVNLFLHSPLNVYPIERVVYIN